MNIKWQIKKLTNLRYRKFKLFAGNPKNPTYLIRFFDREGLMSILYKALGHIEYAQEKGYVPYVDMKHFSNMYRQKGVNAWECFFEQPALSNNTGGQQKLHNIGLLASC